MPHSTSGNDVLSYQKVSGIFSACHINKEECDTFLEICDVFLILFNRSSNKNWFVSGSVSLLLIRSISATPTILNSLGNACVLCYLNFLLKLKKEARHVDVWNNPSAVRGGGPRTVNSKTCSLHAPTPQMNSGTVY